MAVLARLLAAVLHQRLRRLWKWLQDLFLKTRSGPVEKGTQNLMDLPDHVLLHTLGFIEGEELTGLHLVNRRFDRLCLTHSETLRKFKLARIKVVLGECRRLTFGTWDVEEPWEKDRQECFKFSLDHFDYECTKFKLPKGIAAIFHVNNANESWSEFHQAITVLLDHVFMHFAPSYWITNVETEHFLDFGKIVPKSVIGLLYWISKKAAMEEAMILKALDTYPSLKELYLYDFDVQLSKDFFLDPRLRRLDEFALSLYQPEILSQQSADIDDETLLKTSFKILKLPKSTPNLTNMGLLRYLRQWKEGRREIESFGVNLQQALPVKDLLNDLWINADHLPNQRVELLREDGKRLYVHYNSSLHAYGFSSE